MHKATVGLIIAAAIAGLTSISQGAISTVSLLKSGTQSWSDNSTGTVFSLKNEQPAGSGVYNPFVRIKRDDNEQGFNTQNEAGTLDVHPNGPANPVILMNSVVSQDNKITLGLDFNEPGSTKKDPGKSKIVLEDLRLVVSTNGSKSGPTSGSPWSVKDIPFDAGDLELYKMSTTTRTTAPIGSFFNILLDADDRLGNGNGGSGQADLVVTIDVSNIDLTGLLNDKHYLYVYSRFSGSEAGYEEWKLFTPTDPRDDDDTPRVPEPASLGVLGLGALALMARRRK